MINIYNYILLLLLLTPFLLGVIILILINKNDKLKDKLFSKTREYDSLNASNKSLMSDYNNLKSSKIRDEKMRENFRYQKGKKIKTTRHLTIKDKKENFTVDVEGEIVESTDKSVKINPIKVKLSTNSVDEGSVKAYIKNEWIDKSEVQIILDDSDYRDFKIEQILKDE